MALFKDELQKSLKLTSIKGVPRIVGASTKTLKVIWAFSVIILFSICMYHVCTVIANYLEYAKIVTISNKHLDFLNPSKTVPFPTIAVCNMNAFTSNHTAFKESGTISPKEYYNKVMEVTACDNCSVDNKTTMEKLRGILLTDWGYYQSVGKEAMAKVGHKNLIARCTAIISESSSFIGIPCDLQATNFSYIHPRLGMCYAYNAKFSHKRTVLGYEFLLHLDSSYDNINTGFSPNFLSIQSVGAAIYAFDPNTVPNWFGAFALALPGRTTVNQISFSKVERLSTPYSETECIDVEKAEKVLYKGEKFNYELMHCYGECMSQYIVEHCKCTDLFMKYTPETGQPKYGYCASLKLPKEQMLKNMDCSERVKSSEEIHCLKKCKEPCMEVKYSFKSTASKWPLPSQVASFYQSFIKNSVYSEKYSHKENIFSRMAAGDNSVSELDRLLATKAIEDNFATVYVYTTERYYSHMKDEVKMKIGSLMSLLGGAFNLWSGITMLIIVEVLDFFIRLSSCQKSTSMETSHQNSVYESESSIQQ